MSNSKHQRYLQNKETKKLLSEVSREFKVDTTMLFRSKPRVEVVRLKKSDLFMIDNKPFLMKLDERIYPSLIFEEAVRSLPKVTVDKGALPYICNGADIMAPGIREINGGFEKGSIVLIVEETYKKPISIGESLFNSNRMNNMETGKVIKNIHYIGDTIWEYLKSKGLLLKIKNLKT